MVSWVSHGRVMGDRKDSKIGRTSAQGFDRVLKGWRRPSKEKRHKETGQTEIDVIVQVAGRRLAACVPVNNSNLVVQGLAYL